MYTIILIVLIGSGMSIYWLNTTSQGLKTKYPIVNCTDIATEYSYNYDEGSEWIEKAKLEY